VASESESPRLRQPGTPVGPETSPGPGIVDEEPRRDRPSRSHWQPVGAAASVNKARAPGTQGPGHAAAPAHAAAPEVSPPRAFSIFPVHLFCPLCAFVSLHPSRVLISVKVRSLALNTQRPATNCGAARLSNDRHRNQRQAFLLVNLKLPSSVSQLPASHRK
jgi:hypothetical protein